jgi:HK97 family phage prohead protease
MKFTATMPMVLKASGDEGQFEATAYAYGEGKDRHGDIILPGAFADCLERYKRLKSSPAMLWMHKPDVPIGVWTEIEEAETGLSAKGQLELSIYQAETAYNLLKQGGLSLSIGFTAYKADVYKKNDIRYFTKVDLLEISIVSTPASVGAVVHSVKTLADCESARDFESLVRDALGLSRRQAKQLTALAYPVLSGRDGDMTEEQEQAIAAELKAATNLIRSN